MKKELVFAFLITVTTIQVSASAANKFWEGDGAKGKVLSTTPIEVLKQKPNSVDRTHLIFARGDNFKNLNKSFRAIPPKGVKYLKISNVHLMWYQKRNFLGFVETLSRFVDLVHLDISENTFTHLHLIDLSEAIKKMPNLISMNVSSCLEKGQNWTGLNQLIKSAPNLRGLLGDNLNLCNKADSVIVLKAIESLQHLEALSLVGNGIRVASINRMFKSLPQSIVSLSLGGNTNNRSILGSLFSAFKGGKLPALKNIDLSGQTYRVNLKACHYLITRKNASFSPTGLTITISVTPQYKKKIKSEFDKKGAQSNFPAFILH